MKYPGATELTALCVSCSTETGSISILNKSGQSLSKTWRKAQAKDRQSHSEALTLNMQSLLSEANLKISQIDLFAVDVGPGSFTGIRVAINCIRALAFALNKPVLGFDSLDLMALAVFQTAANSLKKSEANELLIPNVLVTLKGPKNQYFSALYFLDGRRFNKSAPSASRSARELLNLVDSLECLHVGEDFEGLTLQEPGLKARLRKLEQAVDFPQSSVMSVCVAKNENIPPTNVWKNVIPLYIRASEAEEKLQGQP